LAVIHKSSNPQVLDLDDREELLRGLHAVSYVHLLLGDDAGHRRGNLGIFEVETRLLEGRACDADRSVRGRDLGRASIRGRLVRVEVFLRQRTGLDELARSREVDARDARIRGGLGDALRASLLEARFCLIERHTVVGRVELDQRLADSHADVVLHVHRDDGPLDARRDDARVAVDLRIIGLLERRQVALHENARHGQDDRRRDCPRQGATVFFEELMRALPTRLRRCHAAAASTSRAALPPMGASAALPRFGRSELHLQLPCFREHANQGRIAGGEVARSRHRIALAREDFGLAVARKPNYPGGRGRRNLVDEGMWHRWSSKCSARAARRVALTVCFGKIAPTRPRPRALFLPLERIRIETRHVRARSPARRNASRHPCRA
jgi:hypothetical protein